MKFYSYDINGFLHDNGKLAASTNYFSPLYNNVYKTNKNKK